MRILALIVAICLAAAPVRAERTDVAVFDAYLAGLRAGTLSISGVEDNGRYTAAVEIQTSGLVRLLQDAGYSARSTGRVTSRGFVPLRYEESANTGDRVSSAVMEYVRGVPQVKAYDPPEEPRDRDVDPATQGGTLDPMTTIYALLRDARAAEVCTLDVFMFDGRRRSQVVLSDPEPRRGDIICSGTYRRVAGFKEKEMRQRTRFPFELVYSEQPDGTFRVTRIEFTTLYGKAVFIRR